MFQSFDKSEVLSQGDQTPLIQENLTADVCIDDSEVFCFRNKFEDQRLYDEYINKSNEENYKQMQKLRQILPAYKLKDDIIAALEKNQVLVITGETGCGKTTQITQFILDDYLQKKNGSTVRICCTQPRRISAFSVAARVAAERNEKLGESVGYQIRLERWYYYSVMIMFSIS